MTSEPKNLGGRPELWEGQPKNRVNISITDEAIQRLDDYAKALGLSRSEIIERFARGILVQPGGLTPEDSRNIYKSTFSINCSVAG